MVKMVVNRLLKSSRFMFSLWLTPYNYTDRYINGNTCGTSSAGLCYKSVKRKSQEFLAKNRFWGGFLKSVGRWDNGYPKIMQQHTHNQTDNTNYVRISHDMNTPEVFLFIEHILKVKFCKMLNFCFKNQENSAEMRQLFRISTHFRKFWPFWWN